MSGEHLLNRIAEMSAEAIAAALEETELSEAILQRLENDPRKSVRALGSRKRKMLEKQQAKRLQWQQMTLLEEKYRALGMTGIAGVDEAGRGPLAGPVVAAAVMLPPDLVIPGLNDSKQLTDNQKETYYRIITEKCVYGIGVVDAARIDAINIYQAAREAMREAVLQLTAQVDIVLVDAVTIPALPYHQEAIIGGDAKSVSIAAASVIAKVTRDRLMAAYDKIYPGYGFARNMGYPTRLHIEAIRRLGLTPIHRRSFSIRADKEA